MYKALSSVARYGGRSAMRQQLAAAYAGLARPNMLRRNLLMFPSSSAARNLAADAKKAAKGKIVSVVGAVVDVQFDGGAAPYCVPWRGSSCSQSCPTS